MKNKTMSKKEKTKENKNITLKQHGSETASHSKVSVKGHFKWAGALVIASFAPADDNPLHITCTNPIRY